MKAMDQELSMYQSHINEYKLKIDRINKELQRVKQKYFNQKKREQQQRDLRLWEEQGQSIQVILQEKKFLDGGVLLYKNEISTDKKFNLIILGSLYLKSQRIFTFSQYLFFNKIYKLLQQN